MLDENIDKKNYFIFQDYICIQCFRAQIFFYTRKLQFDLIVVPISTYYPHIYLTRPIQKFTI